MSNSLEKKASTAGAFFLCFVLVTTRKKYIQKLLPDGLLQATNPSQERPHRLAQRPSESHRSIQPAHVKLGVYKVIMGPIRHGVRALS